MFKASWIAERASSVGSLTFGFFAMCPIRLYFYASGSRHADGWTRFPGYCPDIFGRHEVEAAECPAGCPALPETSYWLGRSNEMARVNRFLIIVNGGTVNTLRNQQF
jgi:hypothetical protein